jgi:cation diffusion facilitator family transporter
MHVIADAATSVLAIAALAGAWATGATWLDPAMALVGAVMVARWAWGLIRASAETLLDHEAPGAMREAVRRAIEADGDTRVTDLHLWSVGPGVYTLVMSVIAHRPLSPDDYKALLPRDLAIDHPIIEVRICAEAH